MACLNFAALAASAGEVVSGLGASPKKGFALWAVAADCGGCGWRADVDFLDLLVVDMSERVK